MIIEKTKETKLATAIKNFKVVKDAKNNNEPFLGFEIRAVHLLPDGTAERAYEPAYINAYGLYAQFDIKHFWLGDYSSILNATRAQLQIIESAVESNAAKQ